MPNKTVNTGMNIDLTQLGTPQCQHLFISKNIARNNNDTLIDKRQDLKYFQGKLCINLPTNIIKKHIANAAKIKLFEDKYRVLYRLPLLWVSQ